MQTLSAARLCTRTLGHTGSACARPLQASPGQSCSQVRTHSFVSTSTNAQKRHLEAVANQSCWCGIAVQLGLIKEGWVGLLEHINMDVHVLMNPTGSSWEYTRKKKKKRFFTWATCLEFVACLILSYIWVFFDFRIIPLTFCWCLHLDPASKLHTRKKRTYFHEWESRAGHSVAGF